jgi:hypothetical protein
MMKLEEALRMRRKCMKLVRQRNQVGGVIWEQLNMRRMKMLMLIMKYSYPMILFEIRNSTQLMISLGK